MYHKSMARGNQGLLEYSLYDVVGEMEVEANTFGAALRINTDELLEYIMDYGYDVEQCARALGTNKAYVALKIDILIEQGYDFKTQEYDRKFWNR